MEVQFTPEQEAQILRIANYSGTPAEQLMKQAALRMVEEEAQFRAGVRRGIGQADRGELIEHDEVKARIQRLLQSKRKFATA
jgi:predicted transcriptional regulator